MLLSAGSIRSTVGRSRYNWRGNNHSLARDEGKRGVGHKSSAATAA